MDSKKICPNCGHSINATSKFCTNCGKKLDNKEENVNINAQKNSNTNFNPGLDSNQGFNQSQEINQNQGINQNQSFNQNTNQNQGINQNQSFNQNTNQNQGINQNQSLNQGFGQNTNFKNGNINLTTDYNLLQHYQGFLLNYGIETSNAYFAISNNQYEDALKFIDLAIQNNTMNANLWALKSYILYQLSYFDDAFTCVDLALNIDDMCELAWGFKTLFLENKNENLTALYCCEEYLSLNPNNGSIANLKMILNNKINSPNQSNTYGQNQGFNNPQQTNNFGQTQSTQQQNTFAQNQGFNNPQQTNNFGQTQSTQQQNTFAQNQGFNNPQQTNCFGQTQTTQQQNTFAQNQGYNSGITISISDNYSSMMAPNQRINIWDLKIDVNDQFNFEGEHTNRLSSFNEIFSPENQDKLERNIMTFDQYNNILERIRQTSFNNFNYILSELNIDLNSLSPLEKVLLYTKSFVEVDTKAVGADLGNYSCNKINLDDRLYTANQITTLIHELSHHLLAEIFEQSLMVIWDTDKTDEIESFVWYTLMFYNVNVLFNEYCAHTVEGRFTPHGYQNYGSFENILHRFDNWDREAFGQVAAIGAWVGNTFSKDILSIIEPFIDYNLREDIKRQFKEDYNHPPEYGGGISLEITQTFDKQFLLEQINQILMHGFVSVIDNRDQFFEIKRKFELNKLNNRGGI